MAVLTQKIKISCQNNIIKGPGAKSNDGHPWRNWKITLVAMDGDREVRGKLSVLLDHVEYILHPTFEEPRRVKTEEPYVLQEKGWGEFDMRVVLYFKDNITDPQVLLFDLNFAMPNYSITHTVEFPNGTPELKKLLAFEPTTSSPPLGPRKGGKRPMASTMDQLSAKNTKNRLESNKNNNNSNGSNGSNSNSNINSKKTIKKKHSQNSVQPKLVKKPEAVSKSTEIKRKTEKPSKKPSKKPSYSPPYYSPQHSPQYLSPNSPKHFSQQSSTILSPGFNDSSSPSTYSSPYQRNKHKSSPAVNYDYVAEKPHVLSTSTGIEDNKQVVKHIYNISDVYNQDLIHSMNMDENMRDMWDVPKINMMELVKRMCRLNDEQSAEMIEMIWELQPQNLDVDEEDRIGVNLYALGKPLLEKLWDFVADMGSDDDQSFTSQDFHSSDLEFDYDMGIEEDDNRSEKETYSDYNIDIDEPGFHHSDNESNGSNFDGHNRLSSDYGNQISSSYEMNTQYDDDF